MRAGERVFRQCLHCRSDLVHCAFIIKIASEFVVEVCDVRVDTALQFVPCTSTIKLC